MNKKSIAIISLTFLSIAIVFFLVFDCRINNIDANRINKAVTKKIESKEKFYNLTKDSDSRKNLSNSQKQKKSKNFWGVQEKDEISDSKISKSYKEFKSILDNLYQAIQSNDQEGLARALNRLKDSRPEIGLLLSEISSTRNSVYRNLLADYLDFYGKNVTIKELEENFNTISYIVNNPEEDQRIRRHLMSFLTKAIAYNQSILDSRLGEDYLSMIKDIAENRHDDPNVVAQAIHSLSRLKITNSNESILYNLQDWKNTKILIAKSSCECLARQKSLRAIPHFIEIIQTTNNTDLFTTAVYSLGFYETPEIIKPLVNNYDRTDMLGKSIIRSTLRKKKDLILKVVDNEEVLHLEPALIALGIIGEKSAIPKLKDLYGKYPTYDELIEKIIRKIVP